MTYTVSGGMLNPTHSLTHLQITTKWSHNTRKFSPNNRPHHISILHRQLMFFMICCEPESTKIWKKHYSYHKLMIIHETQGHFTIITNWTFQYVCKLTTSNIHIKTYHNAFENKHTQRCTCNCKNETALLPGILQHLIIHIIHTFLYSVAQKTVTMAFIPRRAWTMCSMFSNDSSTDVDWYYQILV